MVECTVSPAWLTSRCLLVPFPNVVNRILQNLDIPKDHKKTILASKSWGMNTSYGLGAAFRAAVESGKTLAEAEQAEVEQLQFIYREPVEAQAKLMESIGHKSF